MSNRDYYGQDVPAELRTDNAAHGPCHTRHFEAPATQPSQQPWAQPSSTEQSPQYQQTPEQWRDPTDPAFNEQAEGEKGLGSTIVGGAGGAFVGHKVGKKSDHGTLGAIGGAVAGAIVANMASNAVKGHHGHGGGLSSLRERKRERLESRLDRLH
ncbi:uncharacterized protein BJX67DRAFT_368198 [Aspergillus lucknowensis]|uniref:Glycine zipper 2TM domain-containing protein n=1 Tax=Aspergillus lucknowensis TaxID=176173 RepID=A0ABR4L813_9EURO